MERICRKKEGFKSGMKERVGDEKLIIISVAVRGINDHIRFYSQMLCPKSQSLYISVAISVKQEVLLPQTELTTLYISRHLVNCCQLCQVVHKSTAHRSNAV